MTDFSTIPHSVWRPAIQRTLQLRNTRWCPVQSIPSISYIQSALNCRLVLLPYCHTTCKRTFKFHSLQATFIFGPPASRSTYTLHNQPLAVVAFHTFTTSTRILDERFLHAEISHLHVYICRTLLLRQLSHWLCAASRLPDTAMWG